MSAYTGDIVKDGLTLYLDAGNSKSFVSGSTTWYDISGNGKTGTLTNGPTYNSSNRGTIAFDGSNDYVSVNSFNVNHGTGNFSYSCWAYLSGKPSLGTIFENGSWTNCILIRYETNGITIYSMNAYYGKFTFDPPLNTWNHLTFVRSGNSILFYLNGEFSASTGFGTNLNVNPSPANLFIGVSQHALNQCFNGRLNNLCVYNRALSAAEIRENYNATKGRYDTTRTSDAIKPRLSTNGLVLHLDAANYRSYISGSTTWRDLSGNGNNGTLTNGPTYSSANNGSIVFDGSDDEVLINNADSINFIGSQQYTVLVWAYPNLGGVTWHGIVSKGNSQQYALTINSPNAYLHYETNQGSVTHIDSANNTVSANTWQQFGIRFDGSTKTIWKNGVSIASLSAATLNSTTNTEQLRIGEGNNGEQYRGNIGIVQIYNRALSAAEIAQNFNTNKVRYGYTL